MTRQTIAALTATLARQIRTLTDPACTVYSEAWREAMVQDLMDRRFALLALYSEAVSQ